MVYFLLAFYWHLTDFFGAAATLMLRQDFTDMSITSGQGHSGLLSGGDFQMTP